MTCELLLFLKTYNSCCCSWSPGSAPGVHGLVVMWRPTDDDPANEKNKFCSQSSMQCVKGEEVVHISDPDIITESHSNSNMGGAKT